MESKVQRCEVGEPVVRGGAKEGSPGFGSPAGAGPAGDGAGRTPPPFSPQAPGRWRRPSPELPSYRRIRELLTGEAAANQSAALLFSGRRPGDARTFPRHRRSTLLTHNHSGLHTHCPRDTQHRLHPTKSQ